MVDLKFSRQRSIFQDVEILEIDRKSGNRAFEKTRETNERVF